MLGSMCHFESASSAAGMRWSVPVSATESPGWICEMSSPEGGATNICAPWDSPTQIASPVLLWTGVDSRLTRRPSSAAGVGSE